MGDLDKKANDYAAVAADLKRMMNQVGATTRDVAKVIPVPEQIAQNVQNSAKTGAKKAQDVETLTRSFGRTAKSAGQTLKDVAKVFSGKDKKN